MERHLSAAEPHKRLNSHTVALPMGLSAPVGACAAIGAMLDEYSGRGVGLPNVMILQSVDEYSTLNFVLNFVTGPNPTNLAACHRPALALCQCPRAPSTPLDALALARPAPAPAQAPTNGSAEALPPHAGEGGPVATP